MNLNKIALRIANIQNQLDEQAILVRQSAKDQRGPIRLVKQIQSKLNAIATAMELGDARQAYNLIGKLDKTNKKKLPWDTLYVVRKALSQQMNDEGDDSPFLPKIASMQRECTLYKARDGQWYMDLADEEYGGLDDATTYGPFKSEETTEKYLQDNFSNPGGYSTDDSGKQPVPKISPNGRPVQKPKSHSWRSW